MAADEKEKSVRVLIEGRVQGVWFRAWTAQEATARGLRGWVRNRSDGRVEALFCGPRRVVDDMLDACWRGPPAASVRAVTPTPADPPDGPGFRSLPTL
jgi:acylphosphatase